MNGSHGLGPRGGGGRPPPAPRPEEYRDDALRRGPPVKRVLNRLWPFIRPYLGAMIFGTACVAILEILRKSQPLIMRYLVDHALTPVFKEPYSAELHATAFRRLGYAIGLMLGVSATGTFLGRQRAFTMSRAGAAMVLDLRVFLYNHLQKLSLTFYESRQTGEVMSRVTGDVNAVEDLVSNVSDRLLTDILSIVITLAILFSLSWQLALVSLVPVPALVLFVMWFSRAVRPIYRQIRDLMGGLTARLQDNVAGIRVIKAFNTEPEESSRFERENRRYFETQVKGIRLWTTAFPLMRFVPSTGLTAVTAVGAYMLLQKEPLITLGDFFAFTAYVRQLYDPIEGLFRTYDAVLRSVASGERVVEVLEEAPEIADGPDAVELPPARGHVRFQGVSFRYKTGKQVLQNVELEAKPGEVVALVGRSGAGKTSLVNLIPRFYDPAEGKVTIDGCDVKHVTQRSLRSQIAIVLQDAFLFSGTIKENIRYGKPAASDEEVFAAAKAAYAEEFIRTLPSGYDTEIGERGFKLSGGQKQRISIARALLADRRILILDEATSMMDSEAEYMIQKALARLMEGRTCFVIAHRLSTVRNATKIAVIENGQIAEVGDHTTLLRNNGAYATMYNAQFRLALEEEAELNGEKAVHRPPDAKEPSLPEAGVGNLMG